MSKSLKDAFEALGEALEAAAAAARQIEGVYANSTSKSPNETGDAVAPADKPRGKAKSDAPPVAAKPTGRGKAKGPAITFEILKAKLTEVVNLKGKEEVKTLMSEYGATKLVDIDEESYQEVFDKASALLVEEDEPESGGGADDDMFGE